MVYVPKGLVTVTAGADLPRDYARSPEAVVRVFCGTCGTRLFNRLPHKPDLVGFFPALFPEAVQHDLPALYRPAEHHLAHEAVLDLTQWHDGLPRCGDS